MTTSADPGQPSPRPPSAATVLQRRHAERDALLDRARRLAVMVDTRLAARAVVVFGSVARGDFHDTSDVDVLVVADGLPRRALDRNAALGIPPPRVEVVVWSTGEWRIEARRGNPIATDVLQHGVWLRGHVTDLS